MPRARLRTRAGRWVVVHAAHLHGPHTGGQIAIVLEEARAPEVVPLVGRAYGLSTREWEVTQLVLRGQSTGAIVTALSIASTTVQDHLKAIFEKVGVHSRRELVAQFFAEQYLPRIMAGHQPGFDGAFSV
jgi:ATP/maltotriose-dependent transcriptional regulator MalT